MKLSNYLFVIVTLVLAVNASEVQSQVVSPKSYDKAVVVTADRQASKVGRSILKKGGNAVDAAVAVQFAMAVTTPRAGNIGGGGFMVIRMQGDTSAALDFREEAPGKAHKDMYIRDGEYVPQLSRKGALAVGVPGVVDGMINALERYGNLSLETVLDPAIRLAREGVRLTWRQADRLNRYADDLRSFPASEKYFVKANAEFGTYMGRMANKFIQQNIKKVKKIIKTRPIYTEQIFMIFM